MFGRIIAAIGCVLFSFSVHAGAPVIWGVDSFGAPASFSLTPSLCFPDGDCIDGASGSGSVTSVGLALPVSIFSVSGSPVSTTGTLTGALLTQSANTLFAGPTTGSAAAPAFRLLVPADLPAITMTGDVTGAASGGTIGMTLANTAVTPGTYTLSTVTVDAKGRVTAASNGSAAVTSVGTIDSQSASSNGAVLSGSALVMQSASATAPGLMNTGTQTVAGAKTFSGGVTAAVTGAASLNVLKAGDTMTGALTLPVGSTGAASLNFGTAGTGLYGPSSSAVGVSVSGADAGRFSASGLALGTNTNTTSAQLYIKNTGNNDQTALVIENPNNATAKFDFTNEGSGSSLGYYLMDSGIPFVSYSYARSFVGLGYNTDSNASYWLETVHGSADTDPTLQAPAGTTHIDPSFTLRNSNATAGNYGCFQNTGSSKNLNALACAFNETQTSGSEDASWRFYTAAAGTVAERFRIKKDGSLVASKYAAGVLQTDGSGNISSTTVATSGISNPATIYLAMSTGTLSSPSFGSETVMSAGKTPRAVTIENLEAVASTFSVCTVNPTVTLYDCGTSAGDCLSGQTAKASVTVAAAGTITDGSVSSASIAAGHYWAMTLTAGSCTSLNLSATAEVVMQ